MATRTMAMTHDALSDDSMPPESMPPEDDAVLASDVVTTRDGWVKAKPVLHLQLLKGGEVVAEIWRNGDTDNPFTYDVPGGGFAGDAYNGAARNLKSAKEHIQIILSVLAGQR